MHFDRFLLPEDLSVTIIQTVARQEGKCPAPKTNQNTYIVTHPEIDFTYRPQISEQ